MKAVNNFCKKLHVKWLTGFWMSSDTLSRDQKNTDQKYLKP